MATTLIQPLKNKNHTHTGGGGGGQETLFTIKFIYQQKCSENKNQIPSWKGPEPASGEDLWDGLHMTPEVLQEH